LLYIAPLNIVKWFQGRSHYFHTIWCPPNRRPASSTTARRQSYLDKGRVCRQGCVVASLIDYAGMQLKSFIHLYAGVLYIHAQWLHYILVVNH